MGHVIALVFELAEARMPRLALQQTVAELLERLVDKLSLLLEQGIEPPLLGYQAQPHDAPPLP